MHLPDNVLRLTPLAANFLIASIWQGAVLTGMTALGLRFAVELTAAVRSAIWTVVLLLVVCGPVLPLAFAHHRAGTSGLVHAEKGWGVLLLTLWAAASLFRAGQLSLSALRLQGVAQRAEDVPPPPPLAALFEAPRRARLCVSAEIDRPGVMGFFRPRVLLPPGLLQTLAPSELAQILLHEMEHLRRGDDWWNLVQQVSLVALPFNPALLWLDRRLSREREMACDDSVLRTTRARTAYAACLVKLAEDSVLRQGLRLALSTLGTRARESELGARVRRILARSEVGAATGHGRWIAGTTMLVSVAVASLLALGSPELVSFEVAPATSTRSALAEITQRGGRASADAARLEATLNAAPVRARATVPHPAALPVRRLEVSTARRRLSPLAARPRTAHATLLPGKTPAVMLPPSLVLTEFELSEPVYAAVPWRGGWLIVQL